MRGADHKQSLLFSYVNLEDRIPRDHPLRRVKVLADLVLRSMSDEHFSVDGSLLRAWASHKSMAARDGSDEPPGSDPILST